MCPAIPVPQDGVKGYNTKETTLPGSPALQGVELQSHAVTSYYTNGPFNFNISAILALPHFSICKNPRVQETCRASWRGFIRSQM